MSAPYATLRPMLLKGESLKTRCDTMGLVLTPQRLCVYETLMEMTGHPDIENVYKKTIKKMPTISLNTVYHALSWLEENGFILSVPLGDSPKKFDTVPSPHHHLVCVSCGEIIDLHEGIKTESILPEEVKTNYFVLNVGVTVSILCGECRGKNKRKI